MAAERPPRFIDVLEYRCTCGELHVVADGDVVDDAHTPTENIVIPDSNRSSGYGIL